MCATLILNSKNRIAPANSPNDATYYFDWSAFEEGKYKVSWSIYRPLTTPLQQLLASNAPWGRYDAAAWVAGTNTLTDITGNGRHATTVGVTSGLASGSGATAPIAYLDGASAAATISFPVGLPFAPKVTK